MRNTSRGIPTFNRKRYHSGEGRKKGQRGKRRIKVMSQNSRRRVLNGGSGGEDFNSAGHEVKLAHQQRDDDVRRDPTRAVESIYFEHAQMWMKVFLLILYSSRVLNR